MKITKAKLVKGTYLLVSFSDDNAEITKSYPHTEAPPKLLKAFQFLNHHLCDLTEQHDSTGQPDYDNVVCRGYSMKGEDDCEGVVITGLRTLGTGKTVTLNSPFTNIDISDSDYPKIKMLVEALNRCRDEIATFMDNNKSQDEIQGKLFTANKEEFVVMSGDTADKRGEQELMQQVQDGKEVDVTHLYVKSDEQIQQQMDEAMPLHVSKMSIKQLKELNTDAAREELQRRNADKNRKK